MGDIYPSPSPSTSPTIYQPLHPALLKTLDPEYISYHNTHIAHIPRDESTPWDGTARTKPSLPPGGSPLVPVGETLDFDLGEFQIRAYIPKGKAGKDGWPVFLWFHGGGWAIGGLEDGGDLLSRVCRDAQCIALTISYRLSPEHPFPAALEDALTALQWIASQPFPHHHLNLSKISLGGTSAGGNLALVLALLTLQNPLSFLTLTSLVLVVPVIDNTAMIPESEKDVWWRNRNAPWLTPTRMLWYRKMYLPDESCWADWRASPQLAPSELLAELPRTNIVVSECDLLAPEALGFAEQIRELGVEVEVNVVEGGTHSVLALNGVLKRGAKMVEEVVTEVRKGFGGG